MQMTAELATRILERSRKSPSSLTSAKRMEILMDWLEGMAYKDIQAKYGVSKSAVYSVSSKACREAKVFMEQKSKRVA